MYQNNNHQK